MWAPAERLRAACSPKSIGGGTDSGEIVDHRGHTGRHRAQDEFIFHVTLQPVAHRCESRDEHDQVGHHLGAPILHRQPGTAAQPRGEHFDERLVARAHGLAVIVAQVRNHTIGE
jgi:hypothetical protein